MACNATYSTYGAIKLCDDSGNVIAQTGGTGNARTFRFANLTPGTYFVRIPESQGWIDHWYNHADSFEHATPIEIATAGEVVWIDPTLLEGARISGRVLDALGEPVIAASVVLTSSESDRSLRGSVLTRAGGEFDVIAIPDGSYKVGANTHSRGLVYYPSAAAWDSAGVITIQNHEDVTGIVIQYGP